MTMEGPDGCVHLISLSFIIITIYVMDLTVPIPKTLFTSYLVREIHNGTR